jgi:hypothetical protein
VLALSIPFWIVGAATTVELLPGLPVSALQGIVPLVAAVLLVRRASGVEGVSRLMKRCTDFTRIRRKCWYVPLLLLAPAMTVTTYWVMRALGLPLPTPRFALTAIPAMLVAFLVFALAEELGWSAYATDGMQARWDVPRTGILLGLVWAAWHIVPLMQAHRSTPWIAGWCLGTVANRVIIVWLYTGTGRSVFAATLYHMTLNLSWQLFPNRGSHYDPRVSGVVTAVTAAAVMVAWTRRRRRDHGSRTPLFVRAAGT